MAAQAGSPTAVQAATALDKVTALAQNVLQPINQILSHLEDGSPFMKAVAELSPPGSAALGKLEKIKEMTPQIQALKRQVIELNGLFPDPLQGDKAPSGGSRRKRVKRRASTRGFYRKRRY